MIPVFASILYAFLSVVIVIAMKYETNKRVDRGQLNDDIAHVVVKPYVATKLNITYLIVICGISAICGYVVASKATDSWLAIVEIGICYLATLAAAVIDLKTMTIPNYIPFSVICIRLVFLIFEIIFYKSELLGFLLSSLVGSLICIIILIFANKISKGGIGGGDIKLLTSIGFMCGVYVVFPVLLISLVSSVIMTSILLLLKKRKTTDLLPFAPFIYFGYVIVCLFSLY